VYRAGLIYLMKAVTPLHPGAGESIIGTSDLSIQRNKPDIPIIDGPSLKGGLRSRLKDRCDDELIKLLFGSEPEATPLEAGSIAILDALPLLIPIRSLFGGWAYVTSPWLLFAFSNRLDIVEDDMKGASMITTALALDGLRLKSNEVMAPKYIAGNVDGEDIVVLLDEYVFKRKDPSDSFNIFIKMLSDFENTLKDRLVMVADEFIKIFLSRGMRIQQRVKLTSDKAVDQGPWGEEQIPPDTIMHFAILCSEGRVRVSREKMLNLIKQAGSAMIDTEKNAVFKPEEIRNILKNTLGKSLFFIVGGGESVGRGIIEIQEFKVDKNVNKKFDFPNRVKVSRSGDLELKASISDKKRLSDICRRIEEIPKDSIEDYIKELQGLPTLLAQCGIQSTYFYYRYKGEKEEKRREWWVWKDLSNRTHKLLGEDLKEDRMLDPLRLMLLEWDIMKFAAQLKRISTIKREDGRIA